MKDSVANSYLSDFSQKFYDLTEFLKTIAHPQRLSILAELELIEEISVKTFAERLKVSQSSVSQHLTKLRMSGVVSSRRIGKQVFYRLRDRSIRDFLKFLFTQDVVKEFI